MCFVVDYSCRGLPRIQGGIDSVLYEMSETEFDSYVHRWVLIMAISLLLASAPFYPNSGAGSGKMTERMLISCSPRRNYPRNKVILMSTAHRSAPLTVPYRSYKDHKRLILGLRWPHNQSL